MTNTPSNNNSDLTAQLLGLNQTHLVYLTESTAIHKQMQTAFQHLALAAKKNGIDLAIASGYRSFERQLMIWNNKFSGKSQIKNQQGQTIDTSHFSAIEKINAILLYSALPGASRHHWGCDIDVYAPNLLPKGEQLQLEPWEYDKQGPFAQLSSWLKANAKEYDFYFPYDKFRGGVAAEPWHLSYAPIAMKYQQHFSVEELAKCLSKSDILGKVDILTNLENIVQTYITNVGQFHQN